MAFPVIDRWQDLGALAREIRSDTRAQPLALLAPDETTLAMIDHGFSGAYSVLATDDRVRRAALVRRPAVRRRASWCCCPDTPRATSRAGCRAGTPCPHRAMAPPAALIEAGAARLVQRYELPQGRRYALLGPPGT